MTLASWAAEKAASQFSVTEAEALGSTVEITPESGPTFTIYPTAEERVTTDSVRTVLQQHAVAAIVVVPRTSHYDWSARVLAEAHGMTVLTWGEFLQALGTSDLSMALARPVRYVRGALETHSRVVRVDMVCEGLMRVVRQNELSDVLIAVDEQYEFSAEAVVAAVRLHPDADIICDNNPNGRVTEAAVEQASHAGVEVMKLTDLFTRLHS